MRVQNYKHDHECQLIGTFHNNNEKIHFVQFMSSLADDDNGPQWMAFLPLWPHIVCRESSIVHLCRRLWNHWQCSPWQRCHPDWDWGSRWSPRRWQHRCRPISAHRGELVVLSPVEYQHVYADSRSSVDPKWPKHRENWHQCDDASLMGCEIIWEDGRK